MKKQVTKSRTGFKSNNIMSLLKNTSSRISFIIEDGSKTVMNVSKEFLTDEYGRRKGYGQLKKDIFALQHDFGAIRFEI